MKVYVYTVDPNEVYNNEIIYLKKKNLIKYFDIIGYNFVYYFALKIKDLFRTKTIVKKRHSFLKSLFAPIRLLFVKNIVLVAAPYSNFIIYYMLLLKLLRKNIIFSTSWPYWNTQKYIKKPFLWTKSLWRIFLKNTKVIANTKKTRDELLKWGARVSYIPRSVDMNIFKPDFSKKDGKIKIIYSGRMVEEKGVTDLLEVAKTIENKNVEFIFLGEGKLSNIIKKSSGKKIKYIGYIKNPKEIADIYNQCSIFVLNSYSTEKWEEWFGLSLIEAMSCGLAVISTDCPGPKEIIINEKNGFLINQKNKEQLREKIIKLTKDKKLREKMGENAIKSVEKNYNIDKISEEWWKVINDK